MRYFRHTLQHNVVGANTDSSIGHAVVPSEGRMNGVVGQVHCQTSAVQPFNSAMMYGCDGWMIPVDDPDTVDLIDDIWDRFVEKDFTLIAGSFDLDTAGTDTISFDEPGIGSADRLGGQETLQQSKRFFRRRKMITFQSNPKGFLDATPDVYLPGDVFRVSSKGMPVVDRMSVAVVGFGSPAFASVTTTHKSSPTETEWLQIKYMEVILEQAWMDLAGLTEAGAETPYVEAIALIADMLEPTVIEDTVAAFKDATMDVFCQLTWDLSVPGRRDLSRALTTAS